MAIWAWSIEPILAGPLVAFGTLFGQLLSIGTVRRGLDARLIWPFSPIVVSPALSGFFTLGFKKLNRQPRENSLHPFYGQFLFSLAVSEFFTLGAGKSYRSQGLIRYVYLT
jgi:hypothetical protein